MARKKRSGIVIKGKVKGVKDAGIPAKAVLFSVSKEKVEILAEKGLKKDLFEFDLDMSPDDAPEVMRLVIAPKKIEAAMQLNRLSKAGLVPTAEISKEGLLAKEGRLDQKDLALGSLEHLSPLWKGRHKVCGRVVKCDPVTGEECPVPGAKVTVMDVDLHFFWWHPFPHHPFCWLFPFRVKREEIGSTVTDECGRFCLKVPAVDIDAVLKWRLRFRCLPEILIPPRVIDAISMGVRPDPSIFKELEKIPDLKPKTKPWPGPPPGPEMAAFKSGVSQAPCSSKSASEMGGHHDVEEKWERVPVTDLEERQLMQNPAFDMFFHELNAGQAIFEPLNAGEQEILERNAFPMSIPAPELPCDEKLAELFPDRKPDIDLIKELRNTTPIVRLVRCFAEFVPEWHIFFDVPDIVFKVEQDIDGDGHLETIYDQGFFDVNWNLAAPTTNVVIDAWENAICVPCGPSYSPCTTSGIVGISEMPVDPLYLSSTGYAKRVNRPKPNGNRPEAHTPFCKTIRLVGCPAYGEAAYYKIFYSYEGGPETHFMESWYAYQISAHAPVKVAPDVNGFYKVLTPENDFFPYHTLLNWRTFKYPDGRYKVKLSLFDKNHKPVKVALDPVHVVLDNSRPHPLDYTSLRWRRAGGVWQTLPLFCPIIHRPNDDIEIEVGYTAGAKHLRDFSLVFRGCGGPIAASNYWHHSVGDNLKSGTWTVTMPKSYHQGGYYFYMEARSRSFNAVGGLASNWKYDPVHIRKGRILNVVVLD